MHDTLDDQVNLMDLRQRWPAPADSRPIVFVGAGGIVNDAHLPAYREVGFEIAGVYDLDSARARDTAERWGIGRVYSSLEEALAVPDVVIDVATPPEAILDIVGGMPSGASTLIQKPLGVDLVDATRIRDVCRRRGITAAVNFQLRFSPMMLALRDAIDRRMLGRVVELEVRVNVDTPWQLWPFLEHLDRMEIPLHSIHYLDSIRSILGDPTGVYARTVKHPAAPRLASSRTSAILDYGPDVRCCLSINHHHAFGRKHQASEIRIEGERGAAIARMGVNLDYPRGEPDTLEIATLEQPWRSVPLSGNWFPDAFAGPMSNLQRFVAGEDRDLCTSVEDAWRTMALIETCYRSDTAGATPLITDTDAHE